MGTEPGKQQKLQACAERNTIPLTRSSSLGLLVCNCELGRLRVATHNASKPLCGDPVEPRILHESPDTSKIGESTILLDFKNTDRTRS
jgi:hypothetical protein